MSTFKKMLALVLALAMVLSFSAFAADYKADTYKDAANIDKNCAGAIELMYALGIMKGDANGNFNPTATITRAEIAKMIYVVLNKGNDDQAVNFKYNQMFSDVTGDAWYAGYVNYCAATKLIDGYNGKFNPLQPVTTAQAAKMLLTAIGYSSEERQYTGANWEKNVLSDAAIVGLLDDYNYPTNSNAPRQWVAVMFENMLLKAYTYTTVRPGTANGLITGQMGEVAYDQVKTMGAKYFYLADKTGYLFATDCAYIDVVTKKSDYAGDPRASKLANGNSGYDGIFATGQGDTKWIHVKGAGLGYMDLGQQYRVIWNTNNDRVYSVRNTGKSVVGDAMLKDITSVVNRKTSGNDSANKYIFTIGDMEAAFNSAYNNALVVNTATGTATTIADSDATPKVGYTPNDLYKVAGSLKSDDYRAIDKDGDGDIDYMIIKEYTYAQVTKVTTHRDYGKYFQAINPGGTSYKVNGYDNNTNWYIDDVVNSDSEIEAGNAIKVVYNPDNEKYDVEVLPVATGDYTKRSQDQKKAHTLAGDEYFAAAVGFENPYSQLISSNLKDELTFAYDDNLVVLVGKMANNITDLDEINAQLALVMNAYVDVYSNGYHRFYVDYMTIDGETHEEVRFSGKATGSIDFIDLLDDGTKLAETEKTHNDGDTEDELYTLEYLANHQRLFKLVEHDDGTISLIKLTDENAKTKLNYADSLLSGYEEAWGTLNGEDALFSHGEEDFVANKNLVFVSYDDASSGRMDKLHDESFAVMTLDELGDGKTDTDAAFMQGLYYTKRATKTQLAGHFYANMNDSTGGGYLYTLADGAEETKEDVWYLDEVTFADNTNPEEPILVTHVNGAPISDSNQVYPNKLYSYTTTKSGDTVKYALTLINERINDEDIADTDYRWQVDTDTEFFRFDCVYDDYDDTHATNFNPNETPVNRNSELMNILSSKKIVTSGDSTIPLKGSDITIALKTVTLNRDEDQVVGYGQDGEAICAFDRSEQIAFISYNELIEEDENDNSVLHIYDNDKTDDTWHYYSDLYWKIKDGKIVALYVVVYEVMVEANWAD